MAAQASKRKPISPKIQTAVLLANRHACCVCQKLRVQIHHIDDNPANNQISNLACLCHDHHDMATAISGLTKKLKSNQVKAYKQQWETHCAENIYALARTRFSFFYSMYKNPPRIREAIMRFSDAERKRAVAEVEAILDREADTRASGLFGEDRPNPGTDRATWLALRSIERGEPYPSYVHPCRMHEADPMYPFDFSTQEGLGTSYAFDHFVQAQLQVLVQARGATPLEDLYRLRTEDAFDQFAGRLVTFTGGAWGSKLTLPKLWKRNPVGQIQMRKTISGVTFRTIMNINNMYLFSDTASMNLKRARISGIGMFSGAMLDDTEMQLSVIPLLIGTGGVSAA